MKKLFSILLCIGMLLPTAVAFAAQPITVELDGMPILFDQEPQIVNDRTMVPVRAIFEAMGASVLWDNDTKTVTSTLDGTTVTLTVDHPVMTVNGTNKMLDAAPVILGDRTLVPARAVSESFGCSVKWIGEKRRVRIYSKKFLEKIENGEQFSSVKTLTSEINSGTVAFGMTYFKDYAVKTHTADGTDIEISAKTNTGYISLNVRTDLYVGDDVAITEEYTKDVAENLMPVLSGELIFSGVTSLSGADFMEIRYTAPGNVAGITDNAPEIALYIGRKNGVVYTVTYALYGEVSAEIMGDFNFMLDSLIIA